MNTDERRAKVIAKELIKATYNPKILKEIIFFESKWANFLAEKSRMNKNPQIIAEEFIKRWNEL